LHRIATLFFDAVIFTNFSLEHSEFYATQHEYFKAKDALFNYLKPHGRAIINADDERVVLCASDVQDRVTFGINSPGDFTASLIKNDLTGLAFTIEKAGQKYSFLTHTLLGRFSVYNILAVLAIAEMCGISFSSVNQALSSFEGVPGRLQRFALPNGAVAFIDTAHTPSSFDALLSTLRPLTKDLIVVFGAGGDRDAIKRPLMGALAAQYADKVFITTDNPRSENPQTIIDEIVEGITSDARSKVICESDREQAIRLAYKASTKGSILALLGKGPVEYQHIKDQKIPFSEQAILRSL
jgi:UDP-N-acetylmuramoyl-L-alanyl-D-glutamate--2,6-diaminopimelate ligase